MDRIAIFQNLNVLWTRWPEYEIITDRGAEYLAPAGNGQWKFKLSEIGEWVKSGKSAM